MFSVHFTENVSIFFSERRSFGRSFLDALVLRRIICRRFRGNGQALYSAPEYQPDISPFMRT